MTSTQDLKGLLKAIKKNPNDRVARLALADLFEEQGLAEDAKRQREVVALLSRWHDVGDVRQANVKAGFEWFANSTMRFFGTKLSPKLYIGTSGIFFVTSDLGYDRKRGYSVRRFDPTDSSIRTIGIICDHQTKAQAVAAAKRAADGQE